MSNNDYLEQESAILEVFEQLKNPSQLPQPKRRGLWKVANYPSRTKQLY